MSIKIYNGLRIEVSDIEKFIKWFDKRCMTHVEKQTIVLMGAVKQEKLLASVDMAVGIKKDLSAEEILKDAHANKFFRYLEVCKIYIQAMKGGWNSLNPDSWFNAFIYRDHFYIIPGLPTGITKMKYPKYVEEFGYWNNVDPPNDISSKQWRERERLWEKSGALDIPFRNRLSHELITRDNIGSLVAIEKRVRNIDAEINGVRPFPATYTAELRFDKE